MIATPPPPPENAQCRSCRFWRRRKVEDEADDWGECRRMPPALPEVDDERLVVAGIWPFTKSGDWCGEWEQAEPG